MNVKNFKQRIISSILLFVMIIGLLPLSKINIIAEDKIYEQSNIELVGIVQRVVFETPAAFGGKKTAILLKLDTPININITDYGAGIYRNVSEVQLWVDVSYLKKWENKKVKVKGDAFYGYSAEYIRDIAINVNETTEIVLEELNKNFEGIWHNSYGSTITINNLQTDSFYFNATLLYYPNNTAKNYDNPNIGAIEGKANAVNKNTAQMLYDSNNVDWWSREPIKATIVFELSGDKLTIKTVLPSGYSEDVCFGFGYNVSISGEYYKEKNAEEPFENDLDGIYWIIEPTLKYDNIHYCSWCDLLKDVVDISEIKSIIKKCDVYNGTVYISDAHGIGTNEYFIDKEKEIYAIYYHGEGGESLSYYTFEEFDNYMKSYYSDYEKSLIVFREIDSSKQLEFNEFNNGTLNKEYVSDKYAFAQGTKFITDFIYDDCKVRGNRYSSKNFVDFKLNNKWGIVDKSGKVIIPFIFEDIELIDENRAFVKYNGKYGIIDIEKSVQKTNNLAIKTGKFLYNGGNLDTPGNYEAEYYYSDEYFKDSSYNFKWDLATMSLCLSMSAFGKYSNSLTDKNYSNKDNNVRNLLKNIGFEDKYIDTSLGYPDEPQTHSIGAAFAMKPIILSDNSEYMLVVIAVRGGGYEREWGGNFEIGLGETHEDFSKAKDLVLDAFYKYINRYEIQSKLVNKKIKLWITGYSRGSAVANLLGATFDYEINNSGKLNGLLPMKKADIYTYCFETPAPTKDKDTMNDIYKNIFCIINPNDFVPKFAPEAWGYRRYGETYFIPAPENFAEYYPYLENKMLEKLTQLNKSDTEKFTKEDYVIDDFKFILTRYNKRQSLFLDKLINIVAKDNIKSQFNYFYYYQKNMTNLLTKFGAGELDNIKTSRKIFELVDNAGLSLFGLSIYIRYNDYVSAVIDNNDSIFQGHFPEICLAWLQSINELSNGKYRIVNINCPVDVEVYDSQNNLVANIINNEPQNISGSSIISAIDEDEQKILYLPSMESYTVKIIATDNGKMTYSISDFDSNVGSVVRVVNYYDVDIKKNDILTGYLENLIIEQNAKYELINTTNEKINLSEDITDNDLIYCKITVDVTGNGVASGEGTKTKGEYVKLTAYPNDNEEFLGWYFNNDFISNESSYRFCVLSNVMVEARFTTNTNNSTEIETMFITNSNDLIIDNNNNSNSIIIKLIITIVVIAIIIILFLFYIQIKKKQKIK